MDAIDRHLPNTTTAAVAGNINIQNISRQGFIEVSATAFALALFPTPLKAFSPCTLDDSSMPEGQREEPLLFVQLTPDRLVSVVVYRCDLGQGIRTSFAMLIANKLGADWSQIKAQ